MKYCGWQHTVCSYHMWDIRGLADTVKLEGTTKLTDGAPYHTYDSLLSPFTISRQLCFRWCHDQSVSVCPEAKVRTQHRHFKGRWQLRTWCTPVCSTGLNWSNDAIPLKLPTTAVHRVTGSCFERVPWQWSMWWIKSNCSYLTNTL